MMRFFIFIVLINAALFAVEYQVDKSAKNMVKFISDAPIEDIEGVTDKIDGYIFWEGDDLLNNSELYFEVDLNSIDTGIGLRNRHMRDNYLHTEKYPLTYFTGKLVKADKKNDIEYAVTAKGKSYVHGVEKQKTIEGKMTKTEGDKFKITIHFIVALSDHDIEIPSIMFYKIDENMELILEFYIKKVPENEGEKE